MLFWLPVHGLFFHMKHEFIVVASSQQLHSYLLLQFSSYVWRGSVVDTRLLCSIGPSVVGMFSLAPTENHKVAMHAWHQLEIDAITEVSTSQVLKFIWCSWRNIGDCGNSPMLWHGVSDESHAMDAHVMWCCWRSWVSCSLVATWWSRKLWVNLVWVRTCSE